jgi:tetraacyldisaccharide 4'-kinase
VTKSFADHHRYGPTELAALRDEAQRQGLRLVTTAKDLARLGPAGAGISVLRVRLVFEDQAALRQLVASTVGGAMRTA